jgi:hypothetical protein
MPIPLISHGITEGLSAIPHAYTAIKWAAVVAVVALLKYYFGGARNTSERLMHSKVVMITVCPPPHPLPSLNYIDIDGPRAEHQASAPQSYTTSPRAAPKSSF